MRLTANEIAKLVGGRVLGDGDAVAEHAAPVHQADNNALTFAANEANLRLLPECSAPIAMVAESDETIEHPADSMTLVTVPTDVEEAFLLVAQTLHPVRTRTATGISPAADIAPSAIIGGNTNIHANVTVSEDVEIGTGCSIFPGTVIGRGVKIGNNVVLHPNVVLYDDISIGNDCIIHANSVVGADGFGYRPIDGQHVRIPHVGTVRIEDDVEIGACSTIDRAKVGATVIGQGTKIDNQVMVGHNCEIGKHNLLVSQVGFAGSVTTGSYVVCAGQVGVADHVHLGDGAIFGAQCGVHRSMPGGKTYLGAPAAPVDETSRQLMSLRKLPQLRKTVRTMEKELAALKASLEAQNPSQNTTPKAA